MKFSRSTIATTAVFAVTAAAVVGGVAIAASSGGSTMPEYGAAATGSPGTDPAGRVVLHTAKATVQGTAERILVDSNGFPLYYYQPDTPNHSSVAGQLAVLWPPVEGGSAIARGASGKLTTVATSNGRQIAYNGHFLYTFVQDAPGTVTGQGVQDFYVATPGLNQPSTTDAGAPTASADGTSW
jgi:predicted lipoprotein with Yx(FWY)xxD motif